MSTWNPRVSTVFCQYRWPFEPGVSRRRNPGRLKPSVVPGWIHLAYSCQLRINEFHSLLSWLFSVAETKWRKTGRIPPLHCLVSSHYRHWGYLWRWKHRCVPVKKTNFGCPILLSFRSDIPLTLGQRGWGLFIYGLPTRGCSSLSGTQFVFCLAYQFDRKRLKDRVFSARRTSGRGTIFLFFVASFRLALQYQLGLTSRGCFLSLLLLAVP